MKKLSFDAFLNEKHFESLPLPQSQTHLFFLDNHREYIEKTIKSIAKLKYKDMKKKKKQT